MTPPPPRNPHLRKIVNNIFVSLVSMKKNLYNIYNVCRAYIMTFSMNAIKNNIQPLPEGKNADENNRSYLDALQKKRIALFLNIVTL